MNIDLATSIIKQMIETGVQTFCIAPGGRCAPFIDVLSKSKNINVLYFIDERSAGFFALGRSEVERRPVALVTTSGTALAELLPSVIESYYSGLSLVLLTADRPVSHAQRGCPQTLEYPLDIFKNYTNQSIALSKEEDLKSISWTPSKGNLHLNVSFDQPLIDKNYQSQSFKIPELKSFYPPGFSLDSSKLDSFFQKSKKPLLLVGGLRKKEKEIVKDFLKSYEGFVYAEPFSHISFCKNLLLSGERILYYGEKEKIFDGIVRLGSIPRCSFWRDLDKNSLPVLNLSSPPFYSGLSKDSLNSSLKETLPLLAKYRSLMEWKDRKFKDKDLNQFKKWQEILKTYPESEPYWIKLVQSSLSEKSSVFLGNSLPVRLWDLVSSGEKFLELRGQAGVNGIDGLISRFLGGCEPLKENVAVLGDLSTLYDMSALWKSEDYPRFTLIVINNFGGQIFSQLFSNASFLNQHDLNFEPVAKMWNLDYKLFESSSLYYFKRPQKSNLIEIRPDNEDTKKCLKAYQSLWIND